MLNAGDVALAMLGWDPHVAFVSLDTSVCGAGNVSIKRIQQRYFNHCIP